MSSITNDKQSTFWSFSTFQPMLRLCQISEKNAQARMVLMPEVVLLVLESVVHVRSQNKHGLLSEYFSFSVISVTPSCNETSSENNTLTTKFVLVVPTFVE